MPDKPVDVVICGDCLEVLREIPTGAVHCCVTSPPYWGLRDYGVAGQLGLEKTPEEYVAKMVAVFREVWRVLRDDGTLWLNLGDSYIGSGKAWGQVHENVSEMQRGNKGSFVSNHKKPIGYDVVGLKHKDLAGIPWRLAFALQADGWYLRQDIIWHKPNPMPESVTDRCTKAHEYIFLMTKKPRYFYDAEAIKEESVDPESYTGRDFRQATSIIKAGARPNSHGTGFERGCEVKKYPTRNKRSVWTVPTAPYSEAHFATFPPDLILPCILAGCPQQVCKKCGEPRRRIVERSGGMKGESWHDHNDDIGKGMTQTKDGIPKSTVMARMAKENPLKVETTGWTDCGCNAGFDGGVVLDPFMGSGTVAVVAYQNNRHYIGIELNPEYCKLGRIEKEKDKYGLFGKT